MRTLLATLALAVSVAGVTLVAVALGRMRLENVFPRP
jgi:hypothetical protein